MGFTICGARLVDADGEIPSGFVTVEGARIRAVGHALPALGEVIDATDMVVTPGFVDVHTHGGGSFSLHTTDPDEVRSYTRWAPTTGTTSFLIGVVGVPGSLPEAQLRAAVAAIETREAGAEPLGIHLEGPYLNARHRGAHDPSWLRLPDLAEMERILALSGGHLRLVTLAPELPGATAVIRRLTEAGVTVSLGHTDATYEQAHAAISLGITHATHCFNAMPRLHHREPGALGAVVEAARVRGELIADGVHVHPAAMKVLIRALGPERTVVVTDALPAAGIQATPFDFAGRPAHLVGGAARLADGTLAGSVLTMDAALRNLIEFASVPLREAVGMLTLNPARSALAMERKGRLRAGYDADLLVFDSSLVLQATICSGMVAFATDHWRARLGTNLGSGAAGRPGG